MPKKPGGNHQAFVRLTWKMIEGKAYIELPSSAKAMLPYFLKKVKKSDWDPGYYNTHFVFPYSEAIRYGCAKRTFFRVIAALVENGFIDPVERGGLRGTGLSSSTFKLSDRWKKYGSGDFDRLSWSQFGEAQIRRQVQKRHCVVAKNELEKEAEGVQQCQK